MPLFQQPPRTPEEIERSKPLDIGPEQVLAMDEDEWYRRVYRGDAVPQLTARAVGMGALLGFFLSFTNIYIGLKTGWFLSVALTACILSFSLWGSLMKVGLAKTPMSILENNCMQSTASAAGYSTGNILVSAIPAMLMLSATPEHPEGTRLPFPVLCIWVFFLAVLGVVIAIPLKRNMINRERLRFPSGTAAAVTLQGLYSQGAEAVVKARALLVAGLIGGFVPLLKDLNVRKIPTETTGRALLPGSSPIFDWLPKIHGTAPSGWTMELDHGVALVAAGAIIGLRATFWMVAGGVFLGTWLGPHGLDWEWVNAAGKHVTAVTNPIKAWKEIGIWLGGPMMVAAGLTSFALQWRTIVRAFRGMAVKPSDAPDPAATGEKHADPATVEVPTTWFVIGATVAGVGIVTVAHLVFEIPVHLGALAVVLSMVLALVACRATGETDITPGGPLGKLVQLTYGILMPQSTTANLMTAGISSGAGIASADLLNDLKSGYLLGANPRRQFIAQAMGIIPGTIASVLGFYLLVPDATVFGTGTRKAEFAAPSAQQWKVVAELFKQGLNNLHPMARQCIFWGLVLGVVLALLEAILPRHRKWLPSATGIGLGVLLPFSTPLAFFLGASIAAILERVSKKTAERFVIPVASGLIAGESIIGVVVAALNNFVLR